jgi:hypothetical protein
MVHTSLSNCFARRVICLMINLGASSDSLIIKVDTDLGPFVSFELNSLFPSSLYISLAKFCQFVHIHPLQNLIRKLWIVVLLCQNVEELGHGLRKMLKVSQALHNGSLSSCTDISFVLVHICTRIPTKSLAMMLDCDAKNLECMHANGHTLHPLLALEDQVDRSCEKGDKGVTIRSGQKYAS